MRRRGDRPLWRESGEQNFGALRQGIEAVAALLARTRQRAARGGAILRGAEPARDLLAYRSFPQVLLHPVVGDVDFGLVQEAQHRFLAVPQPQREVLSRAPLLPAAPSRARGLKFRLMTGPSLTHVHRRTGRHRKTAAPISLSRRHLRYRCRSLLAPDHFFLVGATLRPSVRQILRTNVRNNTLLDSDSATSTILPKVGASAPLQNVLARYRYLLGHLAQQWSIQDL